jgi:hypothetical protein
LADGTVQEKSTLAPDRNLQEITDIGNSTTNSIEAFSFIKTGGLPDDILLADGTTIKTNKVGKFVDGTDTNDAVYTAGKVGAGLTTPTAKIHAKASTAGEPLFKLETFGGATTLQADDNGSVWNSGFNSSETNLVFGKRAGDDATGYGNLILGADSGRNPAGGAHISTNSVILGYRACDDSSGGGQNTVAGSFAGRGLNGGFNVIVGSTAMQSDSFNASSENVVVGKDAMNELVGLPVNATKSVIMGSKSATQSNGQTNQIVIGYNTVGNGSNTATIGNNDITDLYVGGDGAGINLKSPNGTTWRLTVDNTGTLNIVA